MLKERKAGTKELAQRVLQPSTRAKLQTLRNDPVKQKDARFPLNFRHGNRLNSHARKPNYQISSLANPRTQPKQNQMTTNSNQNTGRKKKTHFSSQEK